jgi:hypothetical protein
LQLFRLLLTLPRRGYLVVRDVVSKQHYSITFAMGYNSRQHPHPQYVQPGGYNIHHFYPHQQSYGQSRHTEQFDPYDRAAPQYDSYGGGGYAEAYSPTFHPHRDMSPPFFDNVDRHGSTESSPAAESTSTMSRHSSSSGGVSPVVER